MAKSKRNKVVPLSKVKGKFEAKKSTIVESIHKLLDDYKYCYVFKHKNMTNVPLQELRHYWKSSKFVIGKNKVMQVALGKTEDDSYKENSYLIGPFLKGNSGLFFTNEEPDLIIE